MKRVLILGQGQLGTFYKDWFLGKGIEVATPKLDIRDEAAVRQAIAESSPDLVINCVAKTSIDWCEVNRREAYDINATGARTVGLAAKEAGAYLLHISSGCVQESVSADDVKSEEDPAHALCWYAWTKVIAEDMLNELAQDGLKVLMLRPRQLLSAMVSPRNALIKMLTYDRFIETPNSCTVVEDLMGATDELVRQNATGLYNVVNPGVTSPYRIAEMLRDHVKPEMRFSAISKAELNRMTFARRIDAVLSGAKLEAVGVKLRPVEERLVEILRQLKTNMAASGAGEVLEKTAQETREKLLA